MLSGRAIIQNTGTGPVILWNCERIGCEIWTRVMGYYRPVSEFNIGKKAEHNERVFFNEQKAAHSLH
ncbi:MAG: hypothetical protein AVO39_10175 [delta proteobacterium MLS_D]|nr:MAG: hypothetical protein AVO39_10175 [delta proteobacterium MLS_D]